MSASEPTLEGKYRDSQGRKVVFVNAYSVSRNYGGSEEGGWWYDSGEPLASVPVVEEEETVIDIEKERLRKLLGWPKEPRIGRYGVIGGSDFEIYVEDEPGKPFPETRPHYE